MHWYRNIFSHVPSTKVREIAAMLKAIHASEDLAAAREKANRVIEKPAWPAPEPRRRAGGNGGRGNTHLLRLPGGALAADSHQQPARAHPARDPAAHPRRGRPDGQSALNLAAARLRHIAGTAWSTKRYLNIELLKDQQMRGAITA